MIDYDEKCDRLFAIVEDKTYSGDSHNDDIIKFTGFAISGIAKKIGLQPVVHAHWNDSSDGITPYCSACGMSHRGLIRTPDYCPNCGAKMDEEEG